jgi:hypothetical protein
VLPSTVDLEKVTRHISSGVEILISADAPNHFIGSVDAHEIAVGPLKEKMSLIERLTAHTTKKGQGQRTEGN